MAHRSHLNSSISRRSLLAGLAAGVLSLPAWSRRARSAPTHGESAALVVVYLNGGPPGLFNSADSFLARGSFGVTHDNVRSLGNGLFVDKASLGALPAAALGQMASVSFRHGIEHHELARAALLQTGARSNLLMLAQAIGRPAPIRCAVVNSLGLPVGVDVHAPAEGGITLEPVRERDAIPAFDGAGDAIERAYDARSASLADAPSSFAAAERLVRANCSVVFVQPFFSGRPDRQIDTHEDVSGKEARARMATITPALNTFVARLLALPDRNVVITLVGEFCRTVATSDHQPGGTATVIGKHVRTGTSGPQTTDGKPHPFSAPTAGLWAFVAGALQLADNPFGANPHPELLR